MNFATIPAGFHELGWRYTDQLPPAALDALLAYAPLPDLLQRFSGHRKVLLPEFRIATRAVPLSDLMGDAYELDEFEGLEQLCDLVDARLAEQHLRLPVEDELEAACGGQLFAWGMGIPEGIPYEQYSHFLPHREPNVHGLVLNSDPYRVELVRHVFKLGDGGCAICGGDPWPLAWLTLATSFRLREVEVEDCLFETLEQAWIRPVLCPVLPSRSEFPIFSGHLHAA